MLCGCLLQAARAVTALGRRRRESVARVDWAGALRLEAAGPDQAGLYSCTLLLGGPLALVVNVHVSKIREFTISGTYPPCTYQPVVGYHPGLVWKNSMSGHADDHVMSHK